MASTLVGTTPRTGLSVEQVGGNDVYKLLPQLQALLDQGFGNAQQYRKFFAEPVEVDRNIDWYAEDSGNVEKIINLAPEEQQKVLEQLKAILAGLNKYADQLNKNDSPTFRNYAEILKKAMIVPGKDYLDYVYSVDGHPVMIGWGFTEGNNNTVDGIQDLIKQVNLSLEKVTANTQKFEPSPEPEPEPEPELKPATEPEQVVEQQPQPEPEPKPEPQPEKSSSGSLWGVIIGGILVLAGIIAAWYFFFNKDKTPETPPPAPVAEQPKESPFAFLQGEFNTPDNLLEDASSQNVKMNINFPDDSGAGIIKIIEPNQTCEGKTQASLEENNTVRFNVSEITCPNNQNYDPFTLDCQRDSFNCTYSGSDKHWDLTIIHSR